jgi:hypothetical protein
MRILDRCRAAHVSAEIGHRALPQEPGLDPRRGPAASGWRHSAKPVFPARASDGTLPHRLPLII